MEAHSVSLVFFWVICQPLVDFLHKGPVMQPAGDLRRHDTHGTSLSCIEFCKTEIWRRQFSCYVGCFLRIIITLVTCYIPRSYLNSFESAQCPGPQRFFISLYLIYFPSHHFPSFILYRSTKFSYIHSFSMFSKYFEYDYSNKKFW